MFEYQHYVDNVNNPSTITTTTSTILLMLLLLLLLWLLLLHMIMVYFHILHSIVCNSLHYIISCYVALHNTSNTVLATFISFFNFVNVYLNFHFFNVFTLTKKNLWTFASPCAPHSGCCSWAPGSRATGTPGPPCPGAAVGWPQQSCGVHPAGCCCRLLRR